MVQLYASIVLTLIIILLAVLSRRKPTHAAHTQRIAAGEGPATVAPSQTTNGIPYELIAGVLILILAMLVPTPVSIAYKAAILLGLLLTTLGSATERLLKMPASVVHALDLVVAALFTVTLMAHHPLQWPTPWLLLPLVLAGLFFLYLRPWFAELQSTFVTYAVVLWLLLWQTAEVVTVTTGWWAPFAATGMVLFVLIKAMIATAYLRRRALARATPTNPDHSSMPISRSQSAKTRLEIIIAQAESAVQSAAARLKLATIAGRVAALAPLLALLYQWLIVLSIWGPALERYLQELP